MNIIAKKTCSQFRQILNLPAGGIRIIDENFNVIEVNSAFLDMIELNRDEVIGKKCFESFGGSFCKTSSCPLSSILAGKKLIKYEVEKYKIKGDSIICLLTASPFYSDEGEFLGILEDFRDISKLKHSERKLKEQNRKLHDQNILIEHKSIALEQLIQQIDVEKRRTEENIQSNINRIVLPIINSLEYGLKDESRHLIALMRKCLINIVSPYMNSLEQKYAELNQRELELCNMIKNDFTSKQIARLLNLSEETIRARRKIIRRKMGITKSKTPLKALLQQSK